MSIRIVLNAMLIAAGFWIAIQVAELTTGFVDRFTGLISAAQPETALMIPHTPIFR